MGSGQRNVFLNSKSKLPIVSGHGYYMSSKTSHTENHQQEYFNQFTGGKKSKKKKKR